MKTTIALLLSICLWVTATNAQKGKTPVLAPHKETIKSTLPDLTFELLPVIHNAENGYEDVPGSKTQKKMTISFIVKNIGLSDAAPAQVYAEYVYNVADVRPFIRSVQSNLIAVPAIGKGKELLIERRVFVFDTTPTEVYGKDLKFRLVIVATGAGSQKENSTQNNASVEIPFKINR